jgi:hypothetical protein
MPSYIIPGEKVQFFEPPHDEPHGGIETHGGGGEPHEEHEEQLQEYVDPGDSHGIPSGRVHFDDVAHVQEQPPVQQSEVQQLSKKKNNDWIFFIILLLIAVGASIFFRN